MRKTNQGRGKARRKELMEIRWFFLRSGLLLAMVYLLFCHVIGLAVAPNSDMSPRIDQGDLLVYYRLQPSLKAREVVVFSKNDTTYIGRVVACPGETVEIENERLKVNGNQILESETYLRKTPVYEGFVEYPLVLKEDEYFILCDRRDGGEDSRYLGPISGAAIEGVAVAIFRRDDL